MKKLTIQEFINKAKLIHGDKYDYSLVEYLNSRTKVKIICPEHGIFEQEANSHIVSGFGCKKCGYSKNRRNLSYDDFINKAKLIHGNKYDYSLVKFTSVFNLC